MGGQRPIAGRSFGLDYSLVKDYVYKYDIYIL